MNTDLNCSYKNLKYDQACVTLKKQVDVPDLWLYTLSSDCIACPYTRATKLENLEAASITIDTAKQQFWRVFETPGNESYISPSDRERLYCHLSPNVGEFGMYELWVGPDKNCTLQTHKQPVNSYIPLILATGFVFLLLLLLSIWKWVKNRPTQQHPEAPEVSRKTKKRVRSLDTVRGLSILLMVFVNNGAGGYRFLYHTTWNGLLVGDLVFPCFMWIMGVCIPLSVSAQLSRGCTRLSVCRAIIKRSLYLFLIGLALNTSGGNTQLETVRIMGVLQRFSVAYLFSAVVYVLAYRANTSKEKDGSMRDVSMLLPHWLVAILILAGHCAIVFLLPVPGCPKGYLGPGGRHAMGKYSNCSGGATGYVDKLLLGADHVYQYPTTDMVYGSGPFDPEGLLGCLTSIFQVFLGVQAGQTLREFSCWKSRLLRWLSWALVLGFVGATLHYTDVVPVNKNLWSISFVMVTSCLSLGLLSVCYLLVDVLAYWDGGPFKIPGMNSTVMYVGHQIFSAMFPFHWKIGSMNSHGWQLAESVWVVGLWTCIAYMLHRKKVYVSL